MPFFRYDDPRIRYTGRFAPYNESMTATATGSRFAFSFTGETALMQFDMTLMQTPVLHLYIQVDGGARIEVPIDRYLRVTASGDGPHTVEVILKSMVEMFPRWNLPLVNRMSFEGVTAEDLATLPCSCKKTIEFVGDSITEGVLIDPDLKQYPYDQCNRPTQDDVTATYAWLTAEKLGLEPIMMGYGAVGATHGGCGGVPGAPEAYPYCFADAPIRFGHPDYILINHGTNDRYQVAAVFAESYVRLLDVIRTAHPDARIISLIPFVGAFEEELPQIVAQYNQTHGTNIAVINGAHWLPKEPLHPLRDGHKIAAEHLAEELKKVL